MSRTISTPATPVQSATGDPMLVRAGRGLVPTPRAAVLRDRVHELARDAQSVLRPQPGQVDVASLEMTFTIRASEGFLEFLSTAVVAAVTRAAPRVRLHFTPMPDRDAHPLREELVDLEIGLQGTSAPEIRTQFLFRDRLVGVARAGRPLLADAEVTTKHYARCHHVASSREGTASEVVDATLERLNLKRTIMVVVPGYPDAMRIARHPDLVALVPRSCLGNSLMDEHRTTPGLEGFDLPIPVPGFMISAMWHPRKDADPAHRWLREAVMSVCRQA